MFPRAHREVSKVEEASAGRVHLPDVPGQVLAAREAQGAGRELGAVEALRLLLLAGVVSVDAALRPVPTLVGRVHVDVFAVSGRWTSAARGGRYVVCPGRG